MGRTILLVHYNPKELERQSSWAREIGLEVETARNCTEALDAIKTRKFLLILVDPLLPGMSGFALAEKIGELDPSAHVVIATPLYKRMQHMAYPGPHNITLIHLDQPMDESRFKAVLAREHVLPDNESAQGASKGQEGLSLQEVLKMDPELGQLLK